MSKYNTSSKEVRYSYCSYWMSIRFFIHKLTTKLEDSSKTGFNLFTSRLKTQSNNQWTQTKLNGCSVFRLLLSFSYLNRYLGYS